MQKDGHWACSRTRLDVADIESAGLDLLHRTEAWGRDRIGRGLSECEVVAIELGGSYDTKCCAEQEAAAWIVGGVRHGECPFVARAQRVCISPHGRAFRSPRENLEIAMISAAEAVVPERFNHHPAIS